MLYVSTSLPIPVNALLEGRSNDYVYLKLGPSKRDENNKIKHNKLLIGKLCEEPNFFHPNDKYYTHFNITPPTDSITIKPGKKKKEKKDIHYSELPNNSKAAVGYSIASYGVAQKLKIIEILESIFGEIIARKILAIASYFLYTETSSCHQLDVYSKKHILFTDAILTSQRASEIFAIIKPELIGEFFRKWIELNALPDFIFYDVTSISSYSTNIKKVKWGYNRDNENLKQFNLGLFVSKVTRLPLFYSSYDGSINDFQNFQNVLNNARDFGIDDKFTIVFDGIFSTKKTVDYCNYRNNKIIVGLPLSKSKSAKNKILKWRRNKSSIFEWDSELSGDKIESSETEFKIGDVKGRLVMYHSLDRKYLDDISTLEELNEAKKKLKENNNLFNKREKPSVTKYCKCTTIKKDDFVKYKYELDEEKITNIFLTNGCFALFTTDSNINSYDLLKTYRYKDVCEKSFENIKVDIIKGRLYVNKDETLEGKLFVVFISLILRTAFWLALRDMIRQTHSSLMHCIHSLGQVECRKNGDQWVLVDSISAEVRRTLKILEIPIENLEKTIM